MIPIHELLARIRIPAGERFGFGALEEGAGSRDRN
jgi:hypothetical protein